MADVTTTINGADLLHKLQRLDGNDFLRELATEVVQVLLEAERDEAVGTGRYARSDERADTRSGYKPRTLQTQVGRLELRKPQTRKGFVSTLLTSYERVDQAVLTMAAEMYAHGVSTRKVSALLERTIGVNLSPETVSRANQRLDRAITGLRGRPLTETPVLIADARFDKVRRDGAVQLTALLVVKGVEADGRRRILDFQAVAGETKMAWKELFSRLKERGVTGVRLVVSDDHEGLRQAVNEVFPGAYWQRCQTHIGRNVREKAPKKHREELALRLRDIWEAPDMAEAQRRLKALVAEAERWKIGLGEKIEEPISEGLTVMIVPPGLRKRLRTTNALERVNQELKRRHVPARIFPSLEAYERLAGTILVHHDERWQESDRQYIDVEALKTALDEHEGRLAQEEGRLSRTG